MTPITISTAPTMPVEAAKIAPMVMVASARPPGMRPSQSCSTWNSRSAMPERSRMQPISTKGGMADSRYLRARRLLDHPEELDADDLVAEHRQAENEGGGEQGEGDRHAEEDQREQHHEHQDRRVIVRADRRAQVAVRPSWYRSVALGGGTAAGSAMPTAWRSVSATCRRERRAPIGMPA